MGIFFWGGPIRVHKWRCIWQSCSGGVLFVGSLNPMTSTAKRSVRKALTQRAGTHLDAVDRHATPMGTYDLSSVVGCHAGTEDSHCPVRATDHDVRLSLSLSGWSQLALSRYREQRQTASPLDLVQGAKEQLQGVDWPNWVQVSHDWHQRD
eukprot:821500-Pyramimonas_sp.AAC.3